MSKRLWLGCAAAAMLPLTAWAHAKLLGTSPADGAELAAAPSVLALRFNESVQLAVLKLSCNGKSIAVPYDRGAETTRVTVALPPLAPGTCQVRWSALTVDDGHVVHGVFSFVIRP